MSESGGLRVNVVRGSEAPLDTFSWGSIQWLDNAGLTGSETLTLGAVEILAGQANPEHYHPNCDEVLYVVSGELNHTLGDEVHHLQAGDIIHIPRGVRHQGRNDFDRPCRVVVAYNTGRRETIGFGPGEE